MDKPVARHTPSVLRLYLAGPEVFLPQAQALGEAKKALCRHYGFEGLYPLDHPLDELDRLTPTQQGLAISQGNESLIRSADALIANLTPFRGPSADVGTAYELGFARALDLPILAYSHNAELYRTRAASTIDPETGAPLDEDGRLVEDFGLFDNLMLVGGLSAPLFTGSQGNDLANLDGFELTLQWLRQNRSVFANPINKRDQTGLKPTQGV